MEPSCVRHTLIPGTTRLFADYLYDFDRVKQFYPSWFGDLDALPAAAKEIQYPAERRAAIVAALREQNTDTEALDKLARPGTVTVLTGQQVGLFSGPAYTIYKALTAVRIARHLSEQGIEAVPVFWLATEDHDLAEIDHVRVFDASGAPRKLQFTSASGAGGPVGNSVAADIPINALRETLDGLPFADEVVERIAAAYGNGVPLGRAFRQMLQELLAGFGILFIDPLAPSVREIAAPFLQRAASQMPSLVADLQVRERELAEAGYHSQVKVEPNSTLLFVLENGKRRKASGDVSGRALDLSPNAILRPVMEDYLFPTVAYVGGPSEIAYMAQAEVLYRRLLGRMPVIFPRNSFTLLDSRAAKTLQHFHLHVIDVFGCCDQLRSRIAAQVVPESISQSISNVRQTVAAKLEAVRSDLLQFDPTLEASASKSAAKMLYQVDKLAKKVARETLRRDERASAGATYLTNLIYPERHPQERFYSIVPFLAKHGLDLSQRLMEFTQLSCPDHMVRVI